MSRYEIGRDIQELRSRIEILESSFGGHRAPPRSREGGRSQGLDTPAGIDPGRRPIVWRPERDVIAPPVFNRILGLPLDLMLNSAQSTTWHCQPEPLVLGVNWHAGGSDEFYRLQDQLFTIFRATDPNTGITTAHAGYEATLIASGKGASTPTSLGQLLFGISLVNSAGGHLSGGGGGFWVSCHDNRIFGQGFNFNPGLYDIVAGATWQISGVGSVDRC